MEIERTESGRIVTRSDLASAPDSVATSWAATRRNSSDLEDMNLDDVDSEATAYPINSPSHRQGDAEAFQDMIDSM